jgi:hypothetical protein
LRALARKEKGVCLDFEYCFEGKSQNRGWREGERSYLLISGQVEQQVRLDEGLGILMEEGDLLREETREETGVWVRLETPSAWS